MITFDDWQKIEMRTGEVVAAEHHPNADRLLVVRVRVGEEELQVVAGIRGHYEPDQLLGKTTVVLVNLEPATLRGIESQGMLLAVKDGEKVVLLTTDGGPATAGLRVT